MPRLALLIPGVLVWTACGSQNARMSPATDELPKGPPASLVLEDWASPTLELVDAGADPRVALRVPVADPGPAVLVRWENTFETTAKRGLTTTQPSIVRQKRDLLVTPAPGTDATTLDFVVMDAKETARGGPPTDAALTLARNGTARAIFRGQLEW